MSTTTRHYRLSTFFMIAGALLWRVPQVLAIERTSQAFFAPVVSVLTSTNHPDLATWILVGSVVLVALTGAYIFNFVIGRAPRQTPQSSEPRSADSSTRPLIPASGRVGHAPSSHGVGRTTPAVAVSWETPPARACENDS
jgi:hypothetical protein